MPQLGKRGMQGRIEKRRVVITGRGTISPLGHSPAAILNRWAAGVPAAAVVRGLAKSSLSAQVAAEIHDFVPAEHIHSQRLMKMLQRGEDFAVAAAASAFREAAVSSDELDPTRSGIALGCSKECPPIENFFAALKSSIDVFGVVDKSRFARLGLPLLPPLTLIQSLPNGCMYHLAQLHKLEGVNWNLLSYGSGSALAIGESMATIRRGDADLMLAGGYDSWVHWINLTLIGQLGMLSQNGHRPFDLHRDGSVPGEGAGFAVLEDLDRAIARKANIYGELRAEFSASAPGVNSSPSHVLAHCISNALDDAGWGPDAIDVVHLNGDATVDGDSWEVESLQLALGSHASNVPVTSLKSATGHLGNASAAVELFATLEMMNEGRLLPILNLATPDSRFPLKFVRHAAGAAQMKRALLISRGWPANFSVLLFERWCE
jgi:3-oxoacyl-[acyl-carrier-protein] synthase II